MSEKGENLEESLLHAFVWGSLSAGFLGMSHSYLKPAQKHPVVNHYISRYAYGSSICILALVAAVRSAKPKTGREILLMSLVIWGLSGFAVLIGYLLDALTDLIMIGVVNGKEDYTKSSRN